MFHFSSYWCTWSRVLTAEDPRGPYVEVNLTVPAMPSDSAWDKVRGINIRRHGTQLGDRDLIYADLPIDALHQMQKAIGEVLTQRLLTEDFLPQIDWAKYDAVCNGGAAFDSIKK